MNQREFELLVQEVIEGDATAAEVATLEEELRNTPTRRRQYREAFLIHQRLGMAMGPHSGEEAPAARENQPRALPDTARSPGKLRHRLILISAAAAALCLVGVAIQILSPIAPTTGITYTVGPHTEYTISPSDYSTRGKDGQRRLAPGTRVSIRQGSMRVSFDAGTEGILLGAAEFTILGPRGIEMPRGAARFNVTPGGPGFEVVTPMVKVVNLGTNFGVVADGQATPEVHVFKGRVEAAARMGMQEQREIKAGEAMDISDEGQFSKVALDDGRFLKELPPDLPYVWFPFETDTAGNLVAKGTHPAVATMTAEPDPRGGAPSPGKVGQGFAMPGLATPVRTNWLGISGKAPRTIAMWIKVEQNAPWKLYRSLIAWGRQKVTSSTMSELLLATEKDPGSPTTLCFAFNQVFYKGVTNLADGQWHHVAVVFRGDEVRPDEKITTLYVDGKPEEVISEVSRIPFDGPAPGNGEMATPVLIGSIAKPGFDNGFLGSMDELYIFEAALDDERVRELATPPP